ncbi:MAG: hypothetical protein ABIH92_03170 [Nanoarchaeota archaeon]
MRINWYPVMGLVFMLLVWLMIAAGGWFIWKTVLQPKFVETVKVLEINFSHCEKLR